jgi:glycolate oxidase iron-sulfur subunit
VTGRETSSPRGRVYLMRGVAEGAIPLGEAVAEELHLCLGCRASETACPSGVQYGAMLELGREAVARAGLRRGIAPAVERFALRHVVPHRWRLHALTGLLGVAQRLRLDRLVARLGPSRLRTARGLLPPVPARAARRRLPAFTPAEGERRGRVALLEGCVMAELFGEVNRATVRVLVRNGFDVVVPSDQVCCGALLAHAGDLDAARALGRRNLRAFAPDPAAPIDAVVTNSAGCGAALRELDHWLPDSGAALAGRVRDVCEWLDAVGLRAPTTAVPARVAYDDPCHLVHGQRVSEAPRRLLAAIPELEVVAHADASACCGAAGTYSLLQPEMSAAVLDAKMDALAAASPELVATGNPGCMLQLRAGAEARGLPLRVVHPVELLDAAYGGPPLP